MRSLRLQLETIAIDIGLTPVGVTEVGPTPTSEHYRKWIAAGFHGEMDYLERNESVRHDPRNRAPWAKAVMVFACLHAHQVPKKPAGKVARVARYAWGRDYHNLLGKRLKRLTKAYRAAGIQAWGSVDTAPVLERAWVVAAGHGFIGKNTMLINPAQGSYRLLATVFVDQPLPTNTPNTRGSCGSCTRCLTACPTDAFVGPYQLDARKCLSNWTIENTSILPPPLVRKQMGHWFFGCDVCQEVCPHNHNPDTAFHPDLAPKNAWIDVEQLLRTPDEQLMHRFLGTPLRRPKAHGLKRNAAFMLANIGEDDAISVLEEHGLSHEHPVVRGASAYAIHRLGGAIPATDPHPLVATELSRLRATAP